MAMYRPILTHMLSINILVTPMFLGISLAIVKSVLHPAGMKKIGMQYVTLDSMVFLIPEVAAA